MCPPRLDFAVIISLLLSYLANFAEALYEPGFCLVSCCFLLHATSTLLACVGCTYISCFWCLNSAMCSQFGDFAMWYHFSGSEFS